MGSELNRLSYAALRTGTDHDRSHRTRPTRASPGARCRRHCDAPRLDVSCRAVSRRSRHGDPCALPHRRSGRHPYLLRRLRARHPRYTWLDPGRERRLRSSRRRREFRGLGGGHRSAGRELCVECPLNYGYGLGPPIHRTSSERAQSSVAGGQGPIPGHVMFPHGSGRMAYLANKRVVRFREPVLMDREAH